jgi:hypothetical protein
MTIQNIKEELNKDMENLRKKNQTEILEMKSLFSQTKNTVEGGEKAQTIYAHMNK